jgi:hypothetical protein
MKRCRTPGSRTKTQRSETMSSQTIGALQPPYQSCGSEPIGSHDEAAEAAWVVSIRDTYSQESLFQSRLCESWGRIPTKQGD